MDLCRITPVDLYIYVAAYMHLHICISSMYACKGFQQQWIYAYIHRCQMWCSTSRCYLHISCLPMRDTHTYAYIHICTCAYVLTHLSTHAYMNGHTHIHICIYIYTHTHTCMHNHIYIYVYTYMRNIIPIYTDIYPHLLSLLALSLSLYIYLQKPHPSRRILTNDSSEGWVS